ncbi:4-hydroxythreonine-4-phosphate dehydrogenase [Alsobacter sp. SYSU M60028]|uniref:4-hydroxythreonine-4-phosphate dehydrogenase n=1 Tax=Alsobacter ponti TaxID=2962936 RepID=A0ABT1LDH0_9HYPH|nr:4-hydroxythreonine-4-phosphate dehydrogenase [Alsobacter ponti]MCP8939557.1 4-hydroxythreonine-4-phosphate dehydrogenase [Alsobacter ponti]
MLTRDDRTVPDARELLPQVVKAGVTRIGFKDVGIPLSELRTLVAEMRGHGVETYMEVVSLDTSSELKSAEAALELGVDWLLGGVRPEAVLKVIVGSGLRYCPFPGRVVGHPSVLEGPPGNIVASARDIAAMEGVHGLDLLAWRFAGDAPALVEAVCRAVDKPVIVAGSIDRAERIAAVARAGAHAFTIGTAALDAVFPARSKKLEHQIEFIHACLENAGRPDPRSSQVPA